MSPPDGGGVVSFELSADKTRVVYLAEKLQPLRQRLFSASTRGGPVVDLDPLASQGSVSRYRLTPDERHAVFLSDRRVPGVDELLRVPIDGSAPAEPLSDPFPPGGEVVDVRVLADGRVVYGADQETDQVFELLMVPPAPRVRR